MARSQGARAPAALSTRGAAPRRQRRRCADAADARARGGLQNGRRDGGHDRHPERQCRLRIGPSERGLRRGWRGDRGEGRVSSADPAAPRIKASGNAVKARGSWSKARGNQIQAKVFHESRLFNYLRQNPNYLPLTRALPTSIVAMTPRYHGSRCSQRKRRYKLLPALSSGRTVGEAPWTTPPRAPIIAWTV